ncbi:MAG: hypothetical protein RR291_00575, partial [Clostridia bacterium]
GNQNISAVKYNGETATSVYCNNVNVWSKPKYSLCVFWEDDKSQFTVGDGVNTYKGINVLYAGAQIRVNYSGGQTIICNGKVIANGTIFTLSCDTYVVSYTDTYNKPSCYMVQQQSTTKCAFSISQVYSRIGKLVTSISQEYASGGDIFIMKITPNAGYRVGSVNYNEDIAYSHNVFFMFIKGHTTFGARCVPIESYYLFGGCAVPGSSGQAINGLKISTGKALTVEAYMTAITTTSFSTTEVFRITQATSAKDIKIGMDKFATVNYHFYDDYVTISVASDYYTSFKYWVTITTD